MSNNFVTRKESPLVGFNSLDRSLPKNVGVRMSEKAFLGHLNLRGIHEDGAFQIAVKGATGCNLPLEPNTYSKKGDITILWLGPNEWLLVCPEGGAASTAGILREALGNKFAAVTDISGGQTVINLSGSNAIDVLRKGCPVDFHPRVFKPGNCAQSNLAKATITIAQLDNTPSYDLIVRRSFADYLAQWIEDAATEYGLEVLIGGPRLKSAV